jgi:hypothetical protein
MRIEMTLVKYTKPDDNKDGTDFSPFLDATDVITTKWQATGAEIGVATLEGKAYMREVTFLTVSVARKVGDSRSEPRILTLDIPFSTFEKHLGDSLAAGKICDVTESKLPQIRAYYGEVPDTVHDIPFSRRPDQNFNHTTSFWNGGPRL